MELVTVLYFFTIVTGLGYTLHKILSLEEFDDKAEEIIFLLGLGLSAFILLSIPLSIFRLLYWYVFLIIALIVPLNELMGSIRLEKRFGFNLRRPSIYIILGILTLILFIFYFRGAFGYPYLERQ
jgi:hypothetical protein